MAVSRAVALLAMLVLAGCAAPATSDPPPETATFSWGEPVLLPGQGRAYEPTLAVGPEGALYVTAHKTDAAQEGGRLASWLWWAPGADAEWREVRAPEAVESKAFAFEGDVATDAEGRLYFVDTYLDDLFFARYLPSPEGPVQETARPLAVSAGQDDRPWLAAQGDGIVYLATNKADLIGTTVPAPVNGQAGNIWLHVSRDRGGSWTQGFAFEGSRWCTLAVPSRADAALHVGCVLHDERLVALTSRDHGDTFEARELGKLSGQLGANFPASAVDGAGRSVHVFLDHDGDATRVLLARDGHEGILDVTPWEGTFVFPAIAASATGRVAIAFQTEGLRGEGEWRAVALVTEDAFVPEPVWRTVEIDVIGPRPVGDMFDLGFTPDGRLVAAYARAVPPERPSSLISGQAYVRIEST